MYANDPRPSALHIGKAQAATAKPVRCSELSLFGSAARNELHVGSDIDVLVQFDAPATSSRYFGVQFAIEDAIGMPVDLVTENALRKELRPFVERDRIRV